VGIDSLLDDNGWRDRAAVARLMAEWGAIVGAEVAAHVEPVGFTEGELTLQADSTAWATQVRLLLPTLSRAIDRQVGSGTVGRITVLAPQAPSWVSGPRRVKGRGPRDTYG
jgi:predicted nucleic acid-binding Zn ribbon protein